jgi:hypothetical protein
VITEQDGLRTRPRLDLARIEVIRAGLAIRFLLGTAARS